MQKNVNHKANKVWLDFLNFCNKNSQWDLIDLRIHHLYLQYIGYPSKKELNRIRVLEKELTNKLNIPPKIFKSIESYKINNNIYKLDLYAIYVDTNSIKYLIQLIKFKKKNEIKICLENNSNVIISYEETLLSIRTIKLSDNISFRDNFFLKKYLSELLFKFGIFKSAI